MNVDEAMEAAAEFRADAWTLFSETVAVLLAKEVERLRAELAACQNLLDETRTELSICGAFHSLVKEGWQLELEKVNRLEVELAAAKKQFINDCIKHINKVALLNDCEFEGGMIADSVQEYFGDKQCL